MIEVGARMKKLPAPPHVVWESLMQPHRSSSRPWLHLRGDEVEPQVLEVDEPRRLLWSSLWPDRPDDVVALQLAADGVETRLGFHHLTPGPGVPDAAIARRLRRRLSELLYSDLRLTYGQ